MKTPLGRRPRVVLVDDDPGLLRLITIRLRSEGFEVAACQTAIGWEAFGQDKHGPELLGPLVVMAAEESADIRQPVFLRAHGAAIGIGENFLCDGKQRAVALARFALLNEIRVFSKAACINNQRNMVLLQNLFYCADIGKRHRLPAAGVVGNGDNGKRNLLAPGFFNHGLELVDVHVALKRVV